MMKLLILSLCFGSVLSGLLNVVRVCEECAKHRQFDFVCEGGRDRPVILLIRCQANTVRTASDLVVGAVDVAAAKLQKLALETTTMTCNDVQGKAKMVLLGGTECLKTTVTATRSTSRRPRVPFPIPVPVPVVEPRPAEADDHPTSTSTSSNTSSSSTTTTTTTTGQPARLTVIRTEFSFGATALSITLAVLATTTSFVVILRIRARRRRLAQQTELPLEIPLQDRFVSSSTSGVGGNRLLRRLSQSLESVELFSSKHD